MTLIHRFHKLVSEAASPTPSDLPDRFAFLAVVGLALAAAVLGPNSFSLPPAGGIYPSAEGLVFDFLAFLAASAAFVSRTSSRSVRPLAVPLSAAIGLVLLGVCQLLPLPEGFLQKIASANLQIYHETAEILTLFGGARVPAARISIAPRETAEAVLQLLGCVAAFLAAATVLRTRRRRRALFWTVAVGTLVPLVAAGIAAASPSPGAEPLELLGTTFGLGFFAAMGLFWAEVLTNVDRGADEIEPGARFERRFPPLAVRLLLMAACAAGIALARSWAAGAAAALAAGVALTMGLSRRRGERSRRLGAAAAAAAGLVLIGTAVLAPPAQAQPAAVGPQAGDVLRTAIAAWRRFPVFGAGLGGFPDAFRSVQPASLVGYVEQARSGPVQILVTGGGVGLALAPLLIVALFVVLGRGWRSQKHREESAFALAGFGALLFWVLEGLADYHVDSAAISILLAALLGGAWAASQARGSQAT